LISKWVNKGEVPLFAVKNIRPSPKHSHCKASTITSTRSRVTPPSKLKVQMETPEENLLLRGDTWAEGIVFLISFLSGAILPTHLCFFFSPVLLNYLSSPIILPCTYSWPYLSHYSMVCIFARVSEIFCPVAYAPTPRIDPPPSCLLSPPQADVTMQRPV